MTIVKEKEVIIELKDDDPIIEVSWLIPELASSEGQSVNVSCVMSSKRSIFSIIQVGEEMQNKQKELEKEQQLVRDDVQKRW